MNTIDKSFHYEGVDLDDMAFAPNAPASTIALPSLIKTLGQSFFPQLGENLLLVAEKPL